MIKYIEYDGDKTIVYGIETLPEGVWFTSMPKGTIIEHEVEIDPKLAIMLMTLSCGLSSRPHLKATVRQLTVDDPYFFYDDQPWKITFHEDVPAQPKPSIISRLRRKLSLRKVARRLSCFLEEWGNQ